ncbi:MAG: hypothetical protein K8F27_09790 [Sulfuricellaceae bacterium]|nr:hypothetical protein [Sulfuricellaceae bacterium]
MKRYISFLLVGSALLFALEGVAYEVDTHEKLSETAAKNSILSSDTDVLKNLGLLPSIEDNNNLFPNSEGKPRNILNLIKDGANFEDNLSLYRPINHFFNPLNWTGLTYAGLPLPNWPSLVWALENNGQIDGVLGVGKQEFSNRDAREYFFKALTLPDKQEREKNFGLTFQTLGHVIHHIQDMAQPQHVRNDAHLDLPGELPGIENPSLYERYTDRPDVRGRLPFTGYAPVYSAADPTTFNYLPNFWTKITGAGLAQFTNANFVSAGTNFDNPGMFNFPLFDPALRTDMDIQQLCANANPPCPNPNLTGAMTFFGNWVEERI